MKSKVIPNLARCSWAKGSQLELEYHDKEWGNEAHDDLTFFEFLILEGAQAGLSWQTILNKRESYRKAFSNFDPVKVARYNIKDINRLLGNPGIVRNKLKVAAAITNAKSFLLVQKEFGSFNTYIWQFVGNHQVKNKFKSISDVPSKTKESDLMSKDLKKRGFKFVGSTICYAFMQATGMVNDHTIDCFRYQATSSKASFGKRGNNKDRK